jgi:hypothetical protein
VRAGAHPELPYRRTAGGARLHVRLTPKSSTDAVKGLGAGPDGPHLEVRVRALPADGAANAALERLIASWLGVPKSAVSLAAGGKSRYKALDIGGDPEALASALDARIRELEQH